MAKTVFAGPTGSPLSKGIVAGGLLFLSGQVASPGVEQSMGAQTQSTLVNIANALQECGSDVDNVIKATVYLTDMSLKTEMNEVYFKFFENALPTRTTVGVADLGDGVLIEIDVIAEMPS